MNLLPTGKCRYGDHAAKFQAEPFYSEQSRKVTKSEMEKSVKNLRNEHVITAGTLVVLAIAPGCVTGPKEHNL